MELTVATIDCSVKVKCLGVFTNSPSRELTIVFKDNSRLVITEDHSFAVSDLGNYIYVSPEDYDVIFRELDSMPKEVW